MFQEKLDILLNLWSLYWIMTYFYFLFPNTDYKYNLITIIYPPMSISHSQQRAIIFQKD